MTTKENFILFLAVLITAAISLIAVTDTNLSTLTEPCVQTLTIQNQTFSSIEEVQQSVGVPTEIRETLSVSDDTVKVDTCMLNGLNIRGEE